MTRYVYISLSGDKKISLFTMNPATGKLSHNEDTNLDGGPVAMAVNPSKPALYAALESNEVVSLRIDAASGSLSNAGSVSLKECPAMISTDRSGNFLMCAYYGAGAVSVNQINEDGIAGDPQIQWEETTNRAHYIESDAANKFVLVPHVVPGNAIYRFELDESSGRLTLIEPHVTPPDGEGPRHFCFHPNQRFIYTANEDSSTVTAYEFNNSNCELTLLQNVSTLPPEGYTPGEETNSCAQIRITPNGKFLYAPNRGHNTAACFRVGDNGGLSTIGYTPIERHTRGTAIDPDGRYYYTTGTKSGRMASFTISQQTGALEPLENIDVGDTPMWIEIVDQE
jgi:6-phosphogluconolactonase